MMHDRPIVCDIAINRMVDTATGVWSAARHATFKGGRSRSTISQIRARSMVSYSCRSRLPRPRISRHGISGRNVDAMSPSLIADSLMIINAYLTAKTTCSLTVNVCAFKQIVNRSMWSKR